MTLWEFADHLGKGCGTHDRADDVVGVVHPSGPLAERLVDRVLEDPGTFLDGMDPGSEQLHPVDVERLPLDVVHSHEDLALESEVGRQRCGGDAVLSRAGLGDDSLLAHLLGEEALADHVVDLVRAGMVQVLPLQVDLRSSEVLGHPVGVVEHRRPSGVLVVHPVDLGHEFRVLDVLVIRAIELDDRVHEGLGDVLASELSVHSIICHDTREVRALYVFIVH